MIKNIVFDFGGVIADISREQAVKAFIRLGVKDADRILDKYHQTGIFQELEEGSLTEEAYRNELGETMRTYIVMGGSTAGMARLYHWCRYTEAGISGNVT